MRDASLSLANYMLKAYPGIKVAALKFNIALMHNDHAAMMAYLNKYEKEVVWYEDYYGISGTETPLLDTHIGRDSILKEIDAYYGSAV
jgi:hypothetical protein